MTAINPQKNRKRKPKSKLYGYDYASERRRRYHEKKAREAEGSSIGNLFKKRGPKNNESKQKKGAREAEGNSIGNLFQAVEDFERLEAVKLKQTNSLNVLAQAVEDFERSEAVKLIAQQFKSVLARSLFRKRLDRERSGNDVSETARQELERARQEERAMLIEMARQQNEQAIRIEMARRAEIERQQREERLRQSEIERQQREEMQELIDRQRIQINNYDQRKRICSGKLYHAPRTAYSIDSDSLRREILERHQKEINTLLATQLHQRQQLARQSQESEMPAQIGRGNIMPTQQNIRLPQISESRAPAIDQQTRLGVNEAQRLGGPSRGSSGQERR